MVSHFPHTTTVEKGINFFHILQQVNYLGLQRVNTFSGVILMVRMEFHSPSSLKDTSRPGEVIRLHSSYRSPMGTPSITLWGGNDNRGDKIPPLYQKNWVSSHICWLIPEGGSGAWEEAQVFKCQEGDLGDRNEYSTNSCYNSNFISHVLSF